MGNQIVIPSMGNWYIDPLRRKGIGVKNVLESGTFFITLDCYDLKNPQNEYIVKAYESNEPLDKNKVALNCEIYLKNLSDKCKEHSMNGLSIYTPIIQRNLAFLYRKKHQFTLSQRLEEYPPLELVEKRWISYRALILVSLLHEIGFFHGAINPDNIFLTWDLDVSIGDMAPIKPVHIQINRPDLFHHYFATASRVFCYLAPEQLIYSDSSDDVLFDFGKYAMDYFAVGLVIYFTYTGEHMLNFSTLAEISLAMKAKKRSRDGHIDYSDIFDEYIESKIKVLPDDIHDLVKNLLNLDPEQRLCENTIHLFSDSNHNDVNITTPFFPSIFRQISDQLDVFFQKDMSLEHMIRLIPMFQMIIDENQEKINQNIEKHWNSKIPLSKSLKLINSNDVKLFLVNFFTNSLSSSEKVQERASFLNFICDYTLPLSDNTKLSRILPVFCDTLSLPSTLLKTTAMVCILKLIASINEIPEGYEGIFSSYLIKHILNSLNSAEIQYKIAMASICPCLTIEIDRLQTETSTAAVDMTNVILNKEEVFVSNSFIRTMRKISKIRPKKENESNSVNQNSNESTKTTNNTQNELFKSIHQNENETNKTISTTKYVNDAINASVSTPNLSSNEQNTPKMTKTVSTPGIHQNFLKKQSSNSIYGIDVTDGILHHCKFDLFVEFSAILLSYLNSSRSSLKIEILQTLRDFFENSPLSEKRQYRKQFEGMAVILLAYFENEIKSSLLSIRKTTFSENPHNSYDDLKQICDNSVSVFTHVNDEMIEGYLNFFIWFVKENLLNLNYSAELFLRISEFRHSPNPSIRFLSSKLVSSLKINSDTVQYTNFLMKILYTHHSFRFPYRYNGLYNIKKKSSDITLLPKFDNSNLINNSDVIPKLKVTENIEFNQQPLMYKLGLKLNPKFIKSEKLSQSPISIIAPHFNSSIKSLVSDSNGKTFYLKSENLNFECFDQENQYSAISEIRQTNSTMFIHHNQIKIYDWKEQKWTENKLRFDSTPFKIISKEQNVCFALTKDSQLILYDIRCSRFQHTIQFDKNNLTASSMCSWPNNNNHPVLAIGFKEGFVQMVDSRMMLPVASILTDSVNDVSPCYRNCCNFVVASNNTVEVFDAFLGCSELLIELPKSTITPYDGNVVITGNADVFYLDCENFEQSSILYDKEIEKIVLNELDLIDMHRELGKSQSLHKHSAPIIISDHNNELFMSGDETGILNLWCVSDL